MLLGNRHVDKDAHHVLVVLATFAKRDGSGARPGLPLLARRCYMSVTAVAAALDRIQAAGLISKTADLNGGTVVWTLHLTIQAPAQTVVDERAKARRAAAARRQREYRAGLRVTAQSGVTAPVDESVDEPVDSSRVTPLSPVTRDTPVGRDVTGHWGVSHGPVGRDVTPLSPSHLQVTPATTAIPELPENCQNTPVTADRDAQFNDFWALYPKKVEKQGARTAWDAAVARGVEPAAIVAGARRYAAERATDQRPDARRYTKHPTKWLQGGCWEDEPQLGLMHAVGSYVPYRNPIDQSIYDEDLT
ncbi:MAG: hypothetical protein HOQ21_09945 [Dermatophilaceae bacterium]|nr:hypothetical protein [Dermatophilaceae bacterium]